MTGSPDREAAEQDMTPEQIALRDLTEAFWKCYPIDLLEQCENVHQTAQGDYDCYGCRWCVLQKALETAEGIWNV